jgi:hypothetical protein
MNNIIGFGRTLLAGMHYRDFSMQRQDTSAQSGQRMGALLDLTYNESGRSHRNDEYA